MRNTPEVSVVIATHNGARTLPFQLAALADQTDAPPFEVLIVDNCSTDGVGDVAQEWVGHLNLRVIPAFQHQGTSYARNVGIAAAMAPKIALCDDDDCVGRTWVAAASRSLETAELVTGAVTDLPAAAFTNVAAVRDLVPEPDVFEEPRSEVGFDRYPILMGGNCAIRRHLAIELRGFDQRFFPGAEDNDLALRYVTGGGVLKVAPSMVLAARLRPDTSSGMLRAYRAGRIHMLLCQVHELWDVSSGVREPDFRIDLIKAAAAVPAMFLRRNRDWRGVGSRLSLRAGQTVGWAKYRLARRIPQRQLALGFED